MNMTSVKAKFQNERIREDAASSGHEGENCITPIYLDPVNNANAKFYSKKQSTLPSGLGHPK